MVRRSTRAAAGPLPVSCRSENECPDAQAGNQPLTSDCSSGQSGTSGAKAGNAILIQVLAWRPERLRATSGNTVTLPGACQYRAVRLKEA